MSTPSDSSSEPPLKQPAPHRHHPQFIFINEEREDAHSSTQQDTFSTAAAAEESTSTFEQLSELRYAWSLRLMALGLAFCMWLLTAAMAVLTLCAALAVVCTLGYHRPTGRAFQQSYLLCRKAAALALGFSVAVISPPFGFAIIVVYFFLLGERLNSELIHRFIRSSQQKY